jgi:hypothetical protein
MRPEHDARRTIIREWMALPRHKRETQEQTRISQKKRLRGIRSPVAGIRTRRSSLGYCREQANPSAALHVEARCQEARGVRYGREEWRTPRRAVRLPTGFIEPCNPRFSAKAPSGPPTDP